MIRGTGNSMTNNKKCFYDFCEIKKLLVYQLLCSIVLSIKIKTE